MKIDYEILCSAFPDKAWVYAEQLDSVKIGKWNGKEITFYEPIDENLLLELRVFDNNRELKFTNGKFRDTGDYDSSSFVPTLAEARYYMYGEQWEPAGDFTILREDRGGTTYFPAVLDFQGISRIGLKLGIKNFVRYNEIPVLRKGEGYESNLPQSGAGALEVTDYAYTGFYYSNNKVVEL